MDLATLIAKLEAAGEGSRELDFEILQAVFPDMTFRIEPAQPALLMDARVMAKGSRGVEDHVRLEHFTTSIDAALTLIPPACGDDPWFAVERQDGDGNELFFASCCPNESPSALGAAAAVRNSSWAATPALALCIAALRAVAHQEVTRLFPSPRTGNPAARERSAAGEGAGG